MNSMSMMNLSMNVPMGISMGEPPARLMGSSKKKRKRTTPDQLRMLEQIFDETPHPSLALRNQLAQQLCMTSRSVQIWFQNRRAKQRVGPIPGTNGEGGDATTTNMDGVIQRPPRDAPPHREPTPRDSTAADAALLSSLLLTQRNLYSLHKSPAPSSLILGGASSSLINPTPLTTLEDRTPPISRAEASDRCFTAIVHGRLDEVTRLVERCGASVNARASDNSTLLIAAAAMGNLSIVDYLLTCGALVNQVNDVGYSALYLATKNEHAAIVESLLTQKDINVNIQDGIEKETPLHVAALTGSIDTCRSLLNAGAKVNIKDNEGYTTLHHAAVYGYIEIVKLLITHGAGLNAQNNTGNTPLQAAALHAHDEVVKYLIDNGADPNIRDDSGLTALHYATREKHLSTIQCMLDGDDCRTHINAINMKYITPLHMAAEAGDKMICAALLEKGASTDVKNNKGSTPLHLAASQGNYEIAHILLSGGADLEMRDKEGRSPLLVAAGAGHLDIVKLLINGCADVFSKDHRGNNALKCAVQNRHDVVAQYLRTSGARREEEEANALIIDEDEMMD